MPKLAVKASSFDRTAMKWFGVCEGQMKIGHYGWMKGSASSVPIELEALEGIVDFFKNPQGIKRDEKRNFGFVTADDGKRYFFHFNDGNFIEPGKDGARVPTFRPRRKANEKLRYPAEDDQLIFVPKLGDQGPKARYWGYLAEYQAALAQMYLSSSVTEGVAVPR